MQHGGDADAGTEVPWIGGDGDQGLGRGLEQEIVDDCLVVIGDVADQRWQREHDMEVRHGSRSASRAASQSFARADSGQSDCGRNYRRSGYASISIAKALPHGICRVPGRGKGLAGRARSRSAARAVFHVVFTCQR